MTKKRRQRRPWKPKPKRRSKPTVCTFEDGNPICIARPADPKRAMELVGETLKDPNSDHHFNMNTDKDAWEKLQKKLNEECGPYTFVGYLATGGGGKILDQFGEVIDEMRPGDSIMHPSAFEEETL